MSYADRQLERDLERAYYKWFLRVGEFRNPSINFKISPTVVDVYSWEDREIPTKIDTENLQQKHIEINIQTDE